MWSWVNGCLKRRSILPRTAGSRRGRMCIWDVFQISRAIATRRPNIIRPRWRWKERPQRRGKRPSGEWRKLLRNKTEGVFFMQRILMISTLVLATGFSPLLAQKAPAPKSKGEAEALQAVFGAVDPDTRIKAADALLTKYADTDFKALALYLEAVSYSQKNDFEKMVIYAERSVEADPKQYAALLMLAKGIA